MVKIWLYTLISVFVISLMSFVGVITLALKSKDLQKILLFLVSLSAGALFGGVFFHLLPEAIELTGFTKELAIYVLIGLLSFFVLEKFICWRHCHVPTSQDHPHPIAFMNLIGDGFHNFMDGMIIASSYLVSIPLGISTTVAVVLHEIPQEIGDYGVLVHGGFRRLHALILNFCSALLAVVGAVVILCLNVKIHQITVFLVPFTAGGFLYIAGSDLIPELKKDPKPLTSLYQLLFICLGLLIMFLMVD